MKKRFATQRAYTAEEITDWIGRYRASGLGLAPFAAQHGLSRNRLHYWVYGRRSAQLAKPIPATPVFQELKLLAGPPVQNWAAEFSFPTGSVARFTLAATPAWINSVLKGLCRPC